MIQFPSSFSLRAHQLDTGVDFITPYKRKNSAAFQKKMKIFASLRTTDYGDFTDRVRAPTTKGRSEPKSVA